MHLGDFGVEKEEVADTFSYFGATIRTNPNLTDLLAFEAFQAIRDVADVASAVGALRDVLAVFIHPDDVETCWERARANRQGLDEVTDLAMKLLEAATDRPTVPLSNSSDTPRPTGTSSEGGSSSQALRLLAGRPDLQVAVLQASEAG